MSQSSGCLPILLTKTLNQDVQPDLVRYCPTMDLIAVTTRDERVEVYRLSGQRAFVIQRKGKDVQVASLCWKYNGQYLAVSWSDGVADVVSSETGNALQNFRHVMAFGSAPSVDEAGNEKAISCLGWGISLLDSQAGRAKVKNTSNGDHTTHTSDTKVTLGDFLEREPNLEIINMPTDLPEQLVGFDATDLMPKLPTLPVLPSGAYRSGQPSLSELFASQALLDSALHKGPAKELNALNSLLLSNGRGAIRLIVYDSLSIGDISFPGLSHTSSIQHLKHDSHPFAHCHVVLSRIQIAPGQFCMALVPISLRFLRNAGRNIHFIDYKTAQLDTLVQYIGESILAIQYQWKHCQELPSRFQANIEEDLAERKEPNLCQSLYQLAATGYCSEKLSEWLKDELAERGHKRWDQAVSQGYIKVIELLQENLLPAVDRCSAILTSLQGLAQYYEHSPAFDVRNTSFVSIQDIIRCIRLLAHQMLFFASEEQRRFASFSKWLRAQIDIQASDPNSAAGQELLERDSGVNHALVFDYIKSTLQNSRLETFLCHPMDAPEIRSSPEMYGVLRQALEAYKSDKAYDQDVVKLPAYHREWRKHNTSLVEQITSWQRANVLIPGALMLTSDDSAVNAMRMVSDVINTSSSTCTYIAVVGKVDASRLSIFRVAHSDVFDDVPKSIDACDVMNLVIKNGKILSVQFASDDNVFILVEFEHSIRLLSVSLTYTKTDELRPRFEPVGLPVAQMKWPTGRIVQPNNQFTFSSEMINACSIHSFPADGPFQPISVEVSNRKDRRACVLIGQDHRQLVVLGLNVDDASRGQEEHRNV